MTDKDELQLPPELADRVRALAAATGNESVAVLERLVEYAFSLGEGLGAGADLPTEITLVKLHDFAHGTDELAGEASALLDGLDGGEFDFGEGQLAEEIAPLLAGAGVERKRLVVWLRKQLRRDFSSDPSA